MLTAVRERERVKDRKDICVILTLASTKGTTRQSFEVDFKASNVAYGVAWGTKVACRSGRRVGDSLRCTRPGEVAEVFGVVTWVLQFRNCLYKVSFGLLGTCVVLNIVERPQRKFLGKPLLILVVIFFSTSLKKMGGLNFLKVQTGLSLVLECRRGGNPPRMNTATECNGKCKQCAGCPDSYYFFSPLFTIFFFEKELYP